MKKILLFVLFFLNSAIVSAQRAGELTIEQVITGEAESTTFLLIGSIIAIILVIVLIVYFFIIHQRHKKGFQKIQEQRLNKLVNYIRTNMSRGFPKKRIRDALVSVGHHEDQIEKAFRLALR